MALVGHRSVGKTSLGEVLLQLAGVTRTAGRVREGTSLLDHTASERRRGMSLQPDFAWLEWPDPVFPHPVRLLNLIDTPGSDAVAHDRRLACLAADAVVAVIDASEGVQLGAELGLADAVELGIPRFVVITRLDRGCDLGPVLARLAELPGIAPVPLTVPALSATGELRGVLSVVDGMFHPLGTDLDAAPSPMEAEGHDRSLLAAAREGLAEAVAVTNDQLLEAYLEYLGLPDEQTREGLRMAVASGRITPVLVASAIPAAGARPLLDALIELAPSPLTRGPPRAWSLDGEPAAIPPSGDFVAQWVASGLDEDGTPYRVLRVWAGAPPRVGLWTNGNTGETARVRKLYQLRGPRRAAALVTGPGSLVATWDPLPGVPGDAFTEGARLVLASPEPASPMVASWIAPVAADGRIAAPKSAETTRFSVAVGRVLALDPSLWVESDRVATGRVVHAANEAQLAWFVDRLAEWFGVKCRRELAPVPYREVPIKAVTDVEGIYRIEDSAGCATAFGRVVVDLEPASLEIGRVSDGVEVENYLVEDDVPVPLQTGAIAGVHRGLARGPQGFLVVGAVVRMVAGDHDLLVSTSEHLAKAGEVAARLAVERGQTRLAEPWVEVVVWAPPASTGDVLSDLAARRARITGLEIAGDQAAIHATVPYKELRTFGSRLQSQTGGRGRFVEGSWHWELVPAHVVP